MRKKAIITILLVPEASNINSNRRLAIAIKKSLKCDWLAEVENVSIEPHVQKHHVMPSGKEVKTHG